MRNIIKDYKEITKEGCGGCATIRFLIDIEILRLRFFIGRQFFKIKARRRAKKWMEDLEQKNEP